MQSDTDNRTLRVAYCAVPKEGGTFTFYRNMKPALRELGVELTCVTVGRREAEQWNDRFQDISCVKLGANVVGIKKQAQLFADWCTRENVDIVFGVNSRGALSSIPHLPSHVRVLARAANAFPEGYALTLVGRDRIAKVVALTPRLKQDLIRDYHVPEPDIALIPNGVDPAAFEDAGSVTRGGGPRLNLGFLGRLEHKQKGVLHIPKILRELERRGVPFQLRIAGQGVHESELRQQLADFCTAGVVEFVGLLEPGKVKDFLKWSDVFLFTSHFEGCPNALLEAMMAGCVPVCGRISGITDFLVEHEKTGFVCDLADPAEFADALQTLERQRDRLADMAARGARAARDRFSVQATACSYAELFRAVMADKPKPLPPLPWSQFRVEPICAVSWKAYLPGFVKTLAKNLFKK
jgi:glycosyltransferase involved in cell wall biosynthesis